MSKLLVRLAQTLFVVSSSGLAGSLLLSNPALANYRGDIMHNCAAVQPLHPHATANNNCNTNTVSPTISPNVSPTISPNVSPTISPNVSPTNTVNANNHTLVLPNGGNLTLSAPAPNVAHVRRSFANGTFEEFQLPQESASAGVQFWVISVGASNATLSEKSFDALQAKMIQWDGRDAKIRTEMMRDKIFADGLKASNPFIKDALAEARLSEAFDGEVASAASIRQRASELLRASKTIEGVQREIARLSQEREAVRAYLARTSPNDPQGQLAGYDRKMTELNQLLLLISLPIVK